MLLAGTPRRFAIAALLLWAAHALAIAGLAGSQARALASDSLQAAAALLAAAACYWAARRARDFSRQFWLLVGTSFLLWFLAELNWVYLEHVTAPQTGLVPTHVLFFFAFTPLAMSLLLEPMTETRGIDWQRTLDLIQFGIVIFAAYMYFFYLPGRMLATEDSAVTRRLTVLFNARNLFLLCGFLLRAGLSSSRQVRGLFARLSVFMAVYALMTAGANLARLKFNTDSGLWTDLGWSFPFLFAAVLAATWTRQEEKDGQAASDWMTPARNAVGMHLVPTLVPLTVLLMSARIAKEQFGVASVIILASFASFSARLAVSQYRQQKAVGALKEAESKFRLLFAANPHPMWVVDADSLRFLEVNEAAVRRYGYSRDEFLGLRLTQIRPPDEVPRLMESLALTDGIREFGTWRHRCKDGQVITVEIIAEPIQFDGRAAILVLSQDLTERQKLEEQLRQSQKMEAVGTLAGGIAHDFNNLLTVIKGYSCLVMDRVKDDEQLAREVGQIEKAAEKAASLTRQLLAFSRRQVLQPRIINVNNVVASVDNMLRRVIGEHIELVNVAAPDLGMVKADPSQIEQVILNLAVNARDAMAEGGKLTFITTNAVLDDAYAREHLGVRPGRYVMLEVTDTGYGMDPETQRHIFEPFFTTKEVGKGTGLGLSTVYGIVKQSDGYITVESERGKGTTFRIYLPRAEQASASPDANESGTRRVGFETVLLVEDDQVVRDLARKILAGAGYTVLEASRGDEAEELCIRHEGPIQLLITDMVMPGMSGRDLVQRLAGKRPGMKVLFISGYTDTELPEADVKTGTGFLEKPFSPAGLLRKVREVVEGRIIPSSAWTRAVGGE